MGLEFWTCCHSGWHKKTKVLACFMWSKTYAYYLGCGVSVAKQQGAQRRIVGGDEAGFGSFPWQVIQIIVTIIIKIIIITI